MITITVVPPFSWSNYFDLTKINKMKLLDLGIFNVHENVCYAMTVRNCSETHS